MLFKASDRRKFKPFLPEDFRKQVVARLKRKGHSVHINTVGNVWMGRSRNLVVANEILDLISEGRAAQQKIHATKEALAA